MPTLPFSIDRTVQELLDAIAGLVANSPPDRVQQLAGLVRTLSPDDLSAKVAGWPAVARSRLERVVTAARSVEIGNSELAGMLVGAGDAYRRARSEELVDLVWTGPSSELVATRKTEQALLQVIQGARSKLFLTSFVAYDVPSIMTALTAAIEKGATLSMLLESDAAHGGGVSFDVIGMMGRGLPQARIYAWTDKRPGFAGGRVHAKVAVADERVCFISSANLTGHAMETNMEAGVLVEGGDLPRKLHRHLEALVTTRQLTRI